MPNRRQILHNLTLLLPDIIHRFAAFHACCHKLRQLVEIKCAEDDIHMAIFLPQGLQNRFLLHHAAAKRNHRIGIFCFLIVLQPAQLAVYLLLRVFAHTAGVVDDKIGLCFLVCSVKAHFVKHPFQLFGIMRVHLTAHRKGIEFFLSAVFCRKGIIFRTNGADIFQLSCQLCFARLNSSSSFPFHSFFLSKLNSYEKTVFHKYISV